ncbi:sigma-54-dependent Fis family transcriptional regulator [candidate division KSB1 bacterium]|nr:sigma-54-dependent Fis family transcriptional regulator [candidate division KSB1 bacterium]
MNFGDLGTRNPRLMQVMARIAKIALTDLNVLLVGETGTGKEAIAKHIHDESRRRSRPFKTVDCRTIDTRVFGNSFFAYAHATFTGNDSRRGLDLLGSADGGTLFLDEIGEMPVLVQAGLLTVLETSTFGSVESDREVTTDCRVIAATTRSLMELVAQGTFRSDLYYTLGVATFAIPPLRERPEDVPLLAEHMMRAFCERAGVQKKTLSPAAAKALEQYNWPGNVRELRNTVESGMLRCDGDEIGLSDLPSTVANAGSNGPSVTSRKQHSERPGALGVYDRAWTLHNDERRIILRALARHKRVRLAAEDLGISRSTLYRKLEALNIDYRSMFATSVRGPGNRHD